MTWRSSSGRSAASPARAATGSCSADISRASSPGARAAGAGRAHPNSSRASNIATGCPTCAEGTALASSALPQSAGRAAAPAPSLTEIEPFLYREARLLDERRFEAWRDLFTEDGIYWAPTQHDQASPDEAVSL